MAGLVIPPVGRGKPAETALSEKSVLSWGVDAYQERIPSASPRNERRQGDARAGQDGITPGRALYWAEVACAWAIARVEAAELEEETLGRDPRPQKKAVLVPGPRGRTTPANFQQHIIKALILDLRSMNHKDPNYTNPISEPSPRC